MCSDKLKYEPELWEEFKKTIIEKIQALAVEFPEAVLGLNIQNDGKRVKDSPVDEIGEEFWRINYNS